MLVDQCLNGGRAPRPDIVDHLYRVCLLWALLPGVKTIDWLIDWKVSRQRSRVAEFVTVDVWQIQPRERVDSSRRRVGVSNCPWSVPAGGGGRSDWIHWRTPRGLRVAATAAVTHFPPRTPRRFDCRYRRSAPDNYRLQTFTTYGTASIDWLPPAGSPVTPIARALRQVTEK